MRLADLDSEGVWAEVVFPSLGMWNASFRTREALAAAITVSNDWAKSEIMNNKIATEIEALKIEIQAPPRVILWEEASVSWAGAQKKRLMGLLGGAFAAASPAAGSMRAISVPIDTLSPTFATTSETAPAIGEGTSIVALSDSSVTSGCSAFTTSPGFTRTSMTGTSDWTPPFSAICKGLVSANTFYMPAHMNSLRLFT